MKRLFLIITILCLISTPAVSAGHASAIDAAQKLNDDLAGLTPYTVELSHAQVKSILPSADNLTRTGGTYRITIKSASYDASDGILTTNINAWYDSGSGFEAIRINNPVHWYMANGIVGSNGNQRRSEYAGMVVSYLDSIPYGSPINDDTLLIYPSIDGYAFDTTDTTYYPMRNSAGDSAATGSTTTVQAPYLLATTTADQYSIMRRGMLSFNTSTLPDDATVTGATFSLVATALTNSLGSPEFGITGGTLGTNTTIVAGDYDGFGQVRYATDIPYASISIGRNNWSMNAAGVQNISKTAYTIVFFRDSWDIDNSTSGLTWASGATTSIAWRPVGYATSSERPYLEIIYTPSGGGDTTPPDSITNLNNATACSYINWSWTNPATADFNHTYILKDNVFYGNVSNTTVFLNWTGLTASTSYTISTRTVDITGNMNATWVNKTSTTTTCPDTIPPDSITGLANQSLTCNTVDFSWTNPTTADYGELRVWRNNTALTNLTNTTTKVNWTGVPGGTAITFSSKTYDLTGNCNATFVNQTKNTAACPTPPVAAFSVSDTTVCTLDTVIFTDTSSNIPTSWNWSFGDGNLSTLQNPTKIYNLTGNYTVNLTVGNAYGFDSEVKLDYINVSVSPIPTPIPTSIPVGASSGDGDSGSMGIVFGILGGLLGSIIIFRRSEEK